jgi:hypothetical protein
LERIFFRPDWGGGSNQEAMPEEELDDDILDEIVDELCDAAGWFAGGGLSPDQYLLCVVAFEKRKMERFGLKVLGEVAVDGAVWLNVCAQDDGACLVTLKINPRTGQTTIQ